MRPIFIKTWAVLIALVVGALSTFATFFLVAWCQHIATVHQWSVSDRELFLYLVCYKYHVEEALTRSEGKQDVNDLPSFDVITRDQEIDAAVIDSLKTSVDRSGDGILTVAECAEWLRTSGIEAVFTRADTQAALKRWKEQARKSPTNWMEQRGFKLQFASPGSPLSDAIEAWLRENTRWVDRDKLASTLALRHQQSRSPVREELIGLGMIIRIAMHGNRPQVGAPVMINRIVMDGNRPQVVATVSGLSDCWFEHWDRQMDRRLYGNRMEYSERGKFILDFSNDDVFTFGGF